MTKTTENLTATNELDAFSNVNLADSFLLNIVESPNQISFFIEAKLDEAHRAYQAPMTDARGCYRNAELIFPNVRSIVWEKKRLSPILDQNNAVDYGGIDLFECLGEEYRLSGEWGTVKILSDKPQLILKGEVL